MTDHPIPTPQAPHSPPVDELREDTRELYERIQTYDHEARQIYRRLYLVASGGIPLQEESAQRTLDQAEALEGDLRRVKLGDFLHDADPAAPLKSELKAIKTRRQGHLAYAHKIYQWVVVAVDAARYQRDKAVRTLAGEDELEGEAVDELEYVPGEVG